MDLSRANLYFLFTICALIFILLPNLSKNTPLFAFSPFLIATFYQKNYLHSLWIALSCGLAHDLFAAHPPFATHSMAFILATTLIYPLRRHLFADRITTLPLIVYLFSSLVMLFFALLASKAAWSKWYFWQEHLRAILLISIGEALYAWSVFILPRVLFGKPRRKGRDYFA